MPKLLKVLYLCYKVLIVEDLKLLNEIKVHSISLICMPHCTLNTNPLPASDVC